MAMRSRRIRVCLPGAGYVLLFLACSASHAVAQSAPSRLVFTVGVPDGASSQPTLHVSMAVEERALAMWGGGASNFGVAVAHRATGWTLRRSPASRRCRLEPAAPDFQQLELLRTVMATGSFSSRAAAESARSGTARAPLSAACWRDRLGSGRLEGSLVLEHAVTSYRPHDAADVVTTIGWSRSIGERVGFGLESIGQDLEGLWNPAEADGGARLLVGPSLHASRSTAVVGEPHGRTGPAHARQVTSDFRRQPFGIFASANWVPSLRR